MGSNKKTILVVEDEMGMRDLLGTILEEAGYDVALATNVESAMEAIWDRQPDMIMLDIILTGTDGMEICRTVRQSPELSHIPIIVMTGKGPDIARKMGLEAGADDYLPKPFGLAEVTERVAALFEKYEKKQKPAQGPGKQ
ncbi:MAG: response regulator [Elusimicrobia bacterium]|nr:response regulator [Elusimicrobiota bacterium]